jgi:hypothetical protein
MTQPAVGATRHSIGDTFETDGIDNVDSWAKLFGGSKARRLGRALPRVGCRLRGSGRQTVRWANDTCSRRRGGVVRGRLGRPRWARARKPRRPQRRIARATSVYLRTGAAASGRNPSGGRRGFRAAWPRRTPTTPPRRWRDSVLLSDTFETDGIDNADFGQSCFRGSQAQRLGGSEARRLGGLRQKVGCRRRAAGGRLCAGRMTRMADGGVGSCAADSAGRDERERENRAAHSDGLPAPRPSTFGLARRRQCAIRAAGGAVFERPGRGGRARPHPPSARLGTPQRYVRN